MVLISPLINFNKAVMWLGSGPRTIEDGIFSWFANFGAGLNRQVIFIVDTPMDAPLACEKRSQVFPSESPG